MISVTYEQARARFKTLPPRLQEVDSLPESEKFFDSVYEEFRISPDRIPSVAWLIGVVIFGFLKPEDFPRELEETVGLDPLTAKALGKKVQDGFFSSIKSELDQIYSPPGASATPANPVPLRSAPAPTIPPATTAPKPIFNLDATPFTNSTPPLAAQPTPFKPAEPGPKDPAPFFLRKDDSGIRPVEMKQTSPRFSFSSLRFEDARKDNSTKPAQLEIGAVTPKAPAPTRSETAARVVHYSEWSAASPRPSPAPAAVPTASEKPVPLSNLSPVTAASSPTAPISPSPAAPVQAPATPIMSSSPASFATPVTKPAPVVPPSAPAPAAPRPILEAERKDAFISRVAGSSIPTPTAVSPSTPTPTPSSSELIDLSSL